MADKNKETEYTGQLILTNKIISLRGTTILLSNIAKFDQYWLIRSNSIGTLHFVISAFVILTFIPHMYWGLIFVIPAALVIYIGIKQRQRPKLYGITLSLNSGQQYHILSADADGISRLSFNISEALHKDAPIYYNIEFSPKKMIFHEGDNYNTTNSQVGAIGRGASANTNFNNNTTGGTSPTGS